jgi:GT2 family glycosyltransferase
MQMVLGLDSRLPASLPCSNDLEVRSASDTLSVIVVNYNAGNCLRGCVSSAIGQVNEAIVVDNASTDDSLARLEAEFADDQRVKVIRNRENLGFAVACNIGAEVSAGRYLFFLNPDCVLDPDSVKRLARVLDESPDVGMVGGLLVNPDGTEQAGGRRAVPTPWRAFVRASGLGRFEGRWPKLCTDFLLHNQPLPTRPMEVEAISGACTLIRRAVFNEVGRWDERYFLHCEDLDLCMAIRGKGLKIMFVPDARIVHDKGRCSRSRPIFVEWHKHLGMIRFYRKYFRHQYPSVLFCLVCLGVWLQFSCVAMRYAGVLAFGHLRLRRG